MNTKVFCSLAVSAAFAFGGAGSALAAPAGSEGPANCSFSGGTTTCAQVGAPVVTTSTSTDDAGCTLTDNTTTITTTYSAHHGTYNSNGAAVAAPASTSTQSTVLASTVCPPPPTTSGPDVTCADVGGTYDGTVGPSLFFQATNEFVCSGFGSDSAAAQNAARALQPACIALNGQIGVYLNWMRTPDSYEVSCLS